MKRVILLQDAAADFPYPELEDQTPLETSRTPHARHLAREGACGHLKFTRGEADASSSVLAEVCGLPTRQARELSWGPLAAAALNEEPDPGRLRYVCHFLTINEENEQVPVTPGSLEEQAQLLSDLQQAVRRESVRLFDLSLGRFVMDLPSQGQRIQRSPVGYDRSTFLSRLPGEVQRVLDRLELVLAKHPINTVRLDLGDAPLNGIWCWSGGSDVPSPPELPFRQALASPDPLVAGLAAVWNRPFLQLPDPYQTDKELDAFAFLSLLEENDEVVVWIPAPFSSGKFQGAAEKVRRLDAVDYTVTGPLHALLLERSPARLLLLAAGLRHRGRPEKGSGPFVFWGEGVRPDEADSWSEVSALDGAQGSPKLSALLNLFRQP